jgi:hypothetical protein
MKFSAPRKDDTAAKCKEKMASLQMLRRVRFLLREEDKLFISFLNRSLLFYLWVVVLEMVGVVKILCYLFVEMQRLVLLVLVSQINFQNRQFWTL